MYYHDEKNDAIIINELMKLIEDTNEIIRKSFQKYSKYTRVILLGSTGVGKSSLANAIVGHQLTVKIQPSGLVNLTCPDSEFEMGHTMRSETTIPNIYADEENHLLICDAPGFDENRGTNQDIVNSFAINQLFDSNSKIKIIFVFSAQQASIQGSRGYDVFKNFHRITQIIPNQNVLQKAMSIVVSNGEPNLTDNILSNLIEGHPNEIFTKWINFFIKNKKEKVFSFPKASIKQIGKVYEFKDRERLIKSLQNTAVKNVEHNIILSSEAINSVHMLSMKYGTIDDMLNDIINKCRTIYKKDDIQINELKEWQNSFQAIIKKPKSIKTPNNLADLIEQNIKCHELIEEEINKLRCYQSMFTFMNNIESFGIYKLTIEKQTFDIFNNEIDAIKNRINYLNEHNDNIKLKKTTESQSEEIISLKKSSNESSQRVLQLQSTVDQLQSQISQNNQINRELQAKLDEANQKLNEQPNEPNVVSQQILQLIQLLQDGQERTDKEIELIRETMDNSINLFNNTVTNLTPKEKEKTFVDYLGEWGPVLFSAGTKLIDHIAAAAI